jgi:hypothetical protein
MTKRTRQFVFVAAGILVFGLGTGLFASYMGLQNIVLIGRDGPAEFDYIPADAQAVGYVNVRQVMDSELRKKIIELHPGQDVPDFTAQTGIDIRTDIDEVLVALSPQGNQAPLVIAKGRFNTTNIETLIRQHGSTVEDYKGTRMLLHGQAGGAVAFLEPGLAAAGTPESVRLAIDTKASGQNIRNNDALMRFVREVDGGNTWGVAHFDAIIGGRQLPPEIASQLPPITWVSASGNVNGGVRTTLRVEARDETAANDLRQVVQGFIALARLQVGSRPEFADLLNSLQLGGAGTTVSLSLEVPSTVIDALGALAGQRSANRGVVLQERTPLPALPALPAL